MMSRLFVFVSSTSELQQERRSLREELPPRVYDLYLFEEDRARRTSPEEHVRRQIEEADVFLGLLGPGYGSPFPGAEPQRSIVEWEHDVAMSQSGLEVLSFVKELGEGEVRDPRQEAFIGRISQFHGGLWRQTYRTPSELVQRARSALEGFLAEVYVRLQPRRAAWGKRFVAPLIAIPVLAVIGLIALVLSSAATRLTTNAVIGLSVSVLSITLTCGAVLLWLRGGRHG